MTGTAVARFCSSCGSLCVQLPLHVTAGIQQLFKAELFQSIAQRTKSNAKFFCGGGFVPASRLKGFDDNMFLNVFEV